jgi:RNA polymerase sigma-70 factor (ECF subfamily)
VTEPTLADRLAVDLDGAFEAVVLALQRPVYRFAYRYCGNAQDAEEIAQDAFVRAYGALRGYEPERIRALTLMPWLLTIAVNVARNRVRGKRLPTDDLDGVDEPLASGADEPERISERRELSDRLAEALLDLPPRYRAPVILRHVLGMSYDEIAETLEQPQGTVKSNVHRGVQLLRERLTDLDRTETASSLSVLTR